MAVKAIIGIVLLALVPIVSPHESYKIRRDWISTYTYQSNGNGNSAGIEYAKNYGYPTVHNLAGGIGTYRDPITFASQKDQFRPGQRIYIPILHRYFMKEDWCSTCYTRKDHKWQTDLWIGKVSQAELHSTDPASAINWWFRTAIIVNPPRGLKVNTGPLKRVRVG
jgi:hypothetical protein